MPWFLPCCHSSYPETGQHYDVLPAPVFDGWIMTLKDCRQACLGHVHAAAYMLGRDNYEELLK